MAPIRERFAPGELAVVLSHYDLGVIGSAKDFPRGSTKSPKLLLRAEKGRFLLKRRAEGRDRPDRVVFAHALMAHLRAHAFPVPAVVATRQGGGSLLQHEDRAYEMFEFVDGEPYDGSLDETMHAGATLAAFHRAVQDFRAGVNPPEGSFHDLASVRNGLNAIPSTASAHDSVIGHEAELLSLTQHLHERFDDAVAAVNALGFSEWPRSIIHADWHPGNMLFRGGRVVVVLDFDSARIHPRVMDVANGMLQFSILRRGDEPSEWPDYFDETRMRRFLLGYLSGAELPSTQRRAIPHLIIESLIAESVMPIAVTGSFGRIPGFGVLQMVRRKVRWLLDNVERLTHWMLE